MDKDIDGPGEWICNSDCEECTALVGEYEARTFPDRPHDYCECEINIKYEWLNSESFIYVDTDCYRIEVTEFGLEEPDYNTVFLEYEIICKKDNGEDDFGESFREEEDISDWDDLFSWICDKLADAEDDAQNNCGEDCSPKLV